MVYLYRIDIHRKNRCDTVYPWPGGRPMDLNRLLAQ